MGKLTITMISDNNDVLDQIQKVVDSQWDMFKKNPLIQMEIKRE